MARARLKLRSSRITDAGIRRQLGSTEAGSIMLGVTDLIGAFGERAERIEAEQEREHEKAGNLAFLRAKNQYADWVTQYQSSDDYLALSSQDVLDAHNNKIRELVGGLSRWESQAAQLDVDLSVSASQPVMAKKQQEAKVQRQRLAGTVVEVVDRYERSQIVWARALASGDTAAAETAFEEMQGTERDFAEARKLAYTTSPGGWTAEQQNILDLDLADGRQMVMLEAHREHARRTGTVGELWSRIHNRTDRIGQEGERISKGIAPEVLRKMEAEDTAFVATKNSARTTELNRIKAERTAIANEALASAQERHSFVPPEDRVRMGMEEAEKLRRKGYYAQAEEMERYTLAADDRAKTGRDAVIHNTPVAQGMTAAFATQAWTADTMTEIAALKTSVQSSWENEDISETQKQNSFLRLETAALRIRDAEGNEDDASIAFRRAAKPLLAHFNALPGLLSSSVGPEDTQIGMRAIGVFSRLEENYLMGDLGPEDRANHLAIGEAMMLSIYGDEGAGPLGRDTGEERLDGLLRAWFDSKEQPETDGAFARIFLPAHVSSLIKPTKDGSLPSWDAQEKHLDRFMERGPERESALMQIWIAQDLYGKLAANRPLVEVSGERTSFIKALREGAQAGARTTALPGDQITQLPGDQ